MRATDLMETPISSDMLMKLRKGMTASLNAGKLAEVFAALDSGWKIEKHQSYKLSDGGWALKEVLDGAVKPYHISWSRNTDGRIHLETEEPRDLAQYAGYGDKAVEQQTRYRDDAVAKRDGLMRIAEQLNKLQTAPEKGKWFIRDVQVGTKSSRYGNGKTFAVSFEFYVRTGGFLITSPDGQTYEVFGDYKNGAIGAQTFQTWFAWAVENTQIMDEILSVLNMEPFEKKHDPKSRYTPPPGAPSEEKAVFAFLKEMTDGIRTTQKANLVASSKRAVMDFDEAVHSGDKEAVKRLAEGRNGFVISRCYDSRKKTFYNDWETALEKIAEDAVEEMQNMFVFKNTRKLATILGIKGDIGHHQVVKLSADSGIITAGIEFTFEDGSSFYVEQSIVLSWSTYGRPFYRFPTTFHNVKLPGGAKMGLPSEERMNEIWAKAKAGDNQ